MIYRILFPLILAGTTLFAAPTISLHFFKDKPRSLAKDFYISRFLDQNITSNDAKALVGEVKNMNWRLFYKFADKINDDSFKRVAYCRQLPPRLFEGKDADCIKIGLSPYKATKIDPKKLSKIAENIHYRYPHDSDIFTLIAKRSFAALVQSSPKLFLDTFNAVGSRFRERYYNNTLPATYVDKLSRRKGFNNTIVKIVLNPKLDNLQKSILKFDASKLNAQSSFLLGLNALRQGETQVAKWYFKLSEKKAYNNFEKDKAHFWRYLISRDTKLLKELIEESKDINIYTLFAYEKLRLYPQNIHTSIQPKQVKAPFDIKDPFIWLRILKKFKNTHFQNFKAKKAAALTLNSEDTQPHVSKLIYRYQDNKHYYLLAYKRYLQNLSPKRQALILALARQESRFIPTSVSYSYALGLMQFMPFVAKSIAKQNNDVNFQYEDMFDPKIAYHYADLHLDFLQKHLFHPLLVAYAYNAGAGYTKRQVIQNKRLFTSGNYEPFLSMELLPNAQARKYGKKVLANYVIYANILGIKDITLLDQLQKLTKKHRISDF